MSEDSSNENQRPGFWGSTINRLKAALDKTKTAVVGGVLEETSNTVESNPQAIQEKVVESPAQNTSAISSTTVVATKAPPVDIDEDYLENLEEKLIRADLGLATAESLVQHLRKESKTKKWTSWDVEEFLKK